MAPPASPHPKSASSDRRAVAAAASSAASSSSSSSSSWSSFIADPPPSLLAALSVAALALAGVYSGLSSREAASASAVQEDVVAPADRDLFAVDDEIRMTTTYEQDRSLLSSFACPVSSLADLHPLERSPHAYYQSSLSSRNKDNRPSGRRHPVPPPSDEGGATTLVCCRTTAGPVALLVHSNWAPVGAERFLDMVRSGYYDGKAPFHRCSSAGGGGGTWCEFSAGGRTGRKWRDRGEVPDEESNWLWDGTANHDEKKNKEGKGGRGDEVRDGMRRIPRGYVAFAPPPEPGTGRTHHLALAVTDVDSFRSSSTPPSSSPSSGSSRPWEVPFGELVHSSSYETLEAIFTGYGENGPGDRDVMASGGGLDSNLGATFPRMDYVLGCEVIDEEEVPLSKR